MKPPEFTKLLVYGAEASAEEQARLAVEKSSEGEEGDEERGSQVQDQAAAAFEIRKQVVDEQVRIAAGWRRFWFTAASVLLIAAIVAVGMGASLRAALILLALAIVAFIFSRLLVSGPLQQQKRAIQIEEEIREPSLATWERAYKLFRYNGQELREYYNLNRHHSWIMLGTGLICLAFGLAVIVTAGLLVLKPGPGEFTQRELVVGILGGVGGILTNYVAAVYLKMYAAVSHALNEFHNRLVSTHHLHLAYFVASRIEDKKARTEALKQIAHEFSKL